MGSLYAVTGLKLYIHLLNCTELNCSSTFNFNNVNSIGELWFEFGIVIGIIDYGNR